MKTAHQIYAPRPTNCIGCRVVSNWHLKVYTMSGRQTEVDDPTLQSALQLLETIKFPAEKGHGFVIIHRGEETIWLLIDLWMEDILYQELFSAPLSQSTNFKKRVDGPMACVWELVVICHERTAWIKHTMSNKSPDYEAYLADVCSVQTS